MKKYITLLAMIIIYGMGCTKENDGGNVEIDNLDISDAKTLYIEVSKDNPSDNGYGKHTLYKIKRDGSTEKVPILSKNGQEIDVLNMGIAHYNSELLVFSYYYSVQDPDKVFIINKKNGNAKEVPDNMWWLVNVTRDYRFGYVDYYNDQQGNFYALDIGSAQICKYNKSLTKEVLTSGYEVTREYAVDVYGNLIAQIYDATWLYRTHEGQNIVVDIPELKNNQYEKRPEIFVIRDTPGFYYAKVLNEFLKEMALYKLEYDYMSQKVQSTIVSEHSGVLISPDFLQIYDWDNKLFLISSDGAMIIDEKNTIEICRLDQFQMGYTSFFKMKNSFYWFYNDFNGARRLNFQTQAVEDIYDLSGYRIDAVTVEVDETITVYGLNLQTGLKVLVRVKEGKVVSEEPWTDQPVRNYTHWMEL